MNSTAYKLQYFLSCDICTMIVQYVNLQKSWVRGMICATFKTLPLIVSYFKLKS